MRADALDFVLPRFSRQVWTSESARHQWEPRLDGIRSALHDLTLESVSRGDRDCGLIQVRDGELGSLASRCAERGLAAVPLMHSPSPMSTASVTALDALQALVCGPMPPGSATVMVVSSAATESVSRWWGEAAGATVATRLGYPPCCREFLGELVDDRRLDAMWAVACNSARETNDASHVSICATPETNVLWAALGVMPIFHIPCNFGCAASYRLGRQLNELARATGYDTEIGWMEQILSWPVSWSALHGIAETKTPILKMVTRTDATAGKYILDWRGTPVPDSAPTGLTFPYLPPRRLKISDSPGFKRGLSSAERTGSH